LLSFVRRRPVKLQLIFPKITGLFHIIVLIYAIHLYSPNVGSRIIIINKNLTNLNYSVSQKK